MHETYANNSFSWEILVFIAKIPEGASNKSAYLDKLEFGEPVCEAEF